MEVFCRWASTQRSALEGSGFTVLPRHRHRVSYLALVLSGGYEEAGDRGRLHAQAGDAVFHGGYEAHLNRYDADGAEVLNLALPQWMEPQSALMRADDPDLAARLAERDPREAVSYLMSTMIPRMTVVPQDGKLTDWPDELAMDLASNPSLQLRDWAFRRGLAKETISRGFRQVYGVSPSAYRAQIRTRIAWRQTLQGTEALSHVAFETGFSDQAHMTRMVQLLTGRTPGAWRKQGRRQAQPAH
jgi:AraC-like DNA-binding protein